MGAQPTGQPPRAHRTGHRVVECDGARTAAHGEEGDHSQADCRGVGLRQVPGDDQSRHTDFRTRARRPMTLRVGIMLPSRETAMTGEHDARGLVEIAKAAEEAGFDSVWVGDSLLARTRAEPLSILGAVAAVTERVELGTAALIAT